MGRSAGTAYPPEALASLSAVEAPYECRSWRKRGSGVDEPGSSGGGRGVLERAFLVLDALAQRQEAGLSTLANVSGLPKATAHRLLGQLVELGAVERWGARYRVGYRMLRVGHTWQPYPGLREAARGPLKALARTTGTSVAVCVLRGGRTIVAIEARGPHASHAAVSPGTVLPWPTAAGKVLVATSSTPGPLTAAASPASWAREAQAIRTSGIAVELEQLTSGIRCLATPIRDAHGDTVAALAVQTVSTSDPKRLTEALHRASATIAASLATVSDVCPTLPPEPGNGRFSEPKCSARPAPPPATECER